MMDYDLAYTNNLISNKSCIKTVTGWDNVKTQHTFIQSEPFTISSNGSTFTTRCFLKKHLGHPLALGTDLLAQCGLGITGLNLSSNSITKTQAPPLDSQQRPITFTNNKNLTETTYQKFLEAIQPALDRNARISPTSKCNLDYATITIDLKPGSKPVYRKQYTIPQSKEALFEAAIAKWDKNNVTEVVQGSSSWNSALTAAPKRDFNDLLLETRICIDPRHINELTIPIIRQSKSAKAILHTVTESEFFSKIDLVSAYTQLPLHPKSREITSFTWKGVRREFIGAIWGFRNIGIPTSNGYGLPSISSVTFLLTVSLHNLGIQFQMVMDRLLAGCEDFVLNYADDITPHSKTLPDHIIHCITVIDKLTAANLRINQDKCIWAQTEIKVLGFIKSKSEIKIDTHRLSDIWSWKIPTTGKTVMRYLGLFNYFRDRIPNYSMLASPLEKLRYCQKITVAQWTAEAQASFDSLRLSLSLSPVLTVPDFSKPFYVATDSSNYGTGCVLYQSDSPNNSTHSSTTYIEFASRSFSTSEKNYSATKKELLGIVFALRKFHPYLWGRQFTLYTDHNALTYMFTQKDLNGLITGWFDVIMDYDFTVIHRPGIMNVLPDMLSRIQTEFLIASPKSIIQSSHDQIIRSILIQDRLQRIEVAPDNRLNEMEKSHILGHFGASAIVKNLWKNNMAWPNMKEDCVKYVASCPQCQRFNISKTGFNPLTPIHAELPMDHVAIDLFQLKTSCNGSNYCLVVVDVCTRFVFLRPIEDKKMETIAKTLTSIFTDFGFPKIVQSDNGSEFKNQVMDCVMTMTGIDHRLTTPYHPRGNGLAEKFVQTTKLSIIKSLEANISNWDHFVPGVQYAVNLKCTAIHKSSPFSLMFARNSNKLENFEGTSSFLLTEKELMDRATFMHSFVFPVISQVMQQVRDKQVIQFAKKFKTDLFPVGALVMTKVDIQGSKDSAKYEGPFIVLNRTRGGSYQLLDSDKKMLSRNYAPNQMKLISADAIEQEESFVIKKILDHRGPASDREYLVQWKGYPHPDENTWEKFTSFNDISAIEQYWQQLTKTKKKQAP